MSNIESVEVTMRHSDGTVRAWKIEQPHDVQWSMSTSRPDLDALVVSPPRSVQSFLFEALFPKDVTSEVHQP